MTCVPHLEFSGLRPLHASSYSRSQPPPNTRLPTLQHTPEAVAAHLILSSSLKNRPSSTHALRVPGMHPPSSIRQVEEAALRPHISHSKTSVGRPLSLTGL